MNNLHNFEDFSKNIDPKKVMQAAPNAQISAVKEEEKDTVDSVDTGEYSSYLTDLMGKKKAHQEIKEIDKQMQPFVNTYEKIEKEYLLILRELNRIESKKPELKKDVVELKRHFSELLVKLQYFAEFNSDEFGLKLDLEREEKAKAAENAKK